MSAAEVLEKTDPKEVSRIALKGFFNITALWGLKASDQRILLGDPASSTFYKWRNGEGPAVPRDTLERISYIMGIYKALRILYPTEERAAAWPNRPNRRFGGDTPLDVMLKGSVTNLADVRRYLDAMRG